VFRITQGSTVSTELSVNDYSGLDPLPDHIANAQMKIGYDPVYYQYVVYGSLKSLLWRIRTFQPTAWFTMNKDSHHNNDKIKSATV
jgi:hypothetical protein